MSAKKEKNVKEKKKISLTSMIFIALIAGAITGMVLHYLVPDSRWKNTCILSGHNSGGSCSCPWNRNSFETGNWS